MTFQELLQLLDTLANRTLFRISGTEITTVSLATVALIVLLSLLASRLLQKSAFRALDHRGVDDPGTRAIAGKLINILVLGVGFATAVTNIGINLGALFAAGAVFAVGISFAFQNVAQNFLSGLTLLFERSIKPMDILEVEGRVVRVERMGIRATVARTRDDEQIIIPNTVLAQGTVKNYTMTDSTFRVRVSVGVTYDSDMKRVREVLERTVAGARWEKVREPVVLMTAFADSSVNFETSVWTADPWSAPRIASSLHEAIWFALAEAGIVIAFPQLDIHFDPPVHEGFASLPKAS
ncbi:MAG: mechanosensitive ion channel [Longimicrobiales bacterium]